MRNMFRLSAKPLKLDIQSPSPRVCSMLLDGVGSDKLISLRIDIQPRRTLPHPREDPWVIQPGFHELYDRLFAEYVFHEKFNAVEEGDEDFRESTHERVGDGASERSLG